MTDYTVNERSHVLVNETSGHVCFLNSFKGARSIVGSRSTCYRMKKELSRKFPDDRYAVYKLARLGRSVACQG